jgi:gliding motility-associated-like protein
VISFSTELVAIANNPNVNYLWSTDETQSSIIITKHGTYSVTITDENECTAKTSIKILACEPPVFIPSAITPSDQNTLNDCIKIHSSNLINSLDFTIFDRFGGIVYRTFNKEFIWCGEVNGELPLNVIYQYVLIYTDDKGIERIKKGSITVL